MSLQHVIHRLENWLKNFVFLLFMNLFVSMMDLYLVANFFKLELFRALICLMCWTEIFRLATVRHSLSESKPSGEGQFITIIVSIKRFINLILKVLILSDSVEPIEHVTISSIFYEFNAILRRVKNFNAKSIRKKFVMWCIF